MKRIAFILAVIAVPAVADARPADCMFVLNGKPIINGPCDFDPLPPGDDISKGSFQITAGDNFATVNISPSGQALGFFNEFPGSQQPSGRLGPMSPAGACWQNASSKICAWKPGEREQASKVSPQQLVGTPADTYCRRMASQALSFGQQVYQDCMVRQARNMSK